MSRPPLPDGQVARRLYVPLTDEEWGSVKELSSDQRRAALLTAAQTAGGTMDELTMAVAAGLGNPHAVRRGLPAWARRTAREWSEFVPEGEAWEDFRANRVEELQNDLATTAPQPTYAMLQIAAENGEEPHRALLRLIYAELTPARRAEAATLRRLARAMHEQEEGSPAEREASRAYALYQEAVVAGDRAATN